jgi:hypothetical protein
MFELLKDPAYFAQVAKTAEQLGGLTGSISTR